MCPLGLGLEFCDVSALQAQNKITGQSRQILFEWLPPQTQDLHGFFLAYATTGSHRARAQSAVADGARNRNRTPRVHGINATCVTAPKTCRSTTRGSCSLSPLSYPFTKFLPEQRVDRDGMIQSHARSIEHEHEHEKNPEQAAAPKCAVFFST